MDITITIPLTVEGLTEAVDQLSQHRDALSAAEALASADAWDEDVNGPAANGGRPIPFRVATEEERSAAAAGIPLPGEAADTDAAMARTPPLAPSNLDSAGVAYDPEIHTKSRVKKMNGEWKAKRGTGVAPPPPPPAGPEVAALLGKLIAAGVDHAVLDASVSEAIGVDEGGLKTVLTGTDAAVTEKGRLCLEAQCLEAGVAL
jgi:hypothetical protein